MHASCLVLYIHTAPPSIGAVFMIGMNGAGFGWNLESLADPNWQAKKRWCRCTGSATLLRVVSIVVLVVLIVLVFWGRPRGDNLAELATR